MQALFHRVSRHVNRFTRIGVASGVIDAGGKAAGGRREFLDLFDNVRDEYGKTLAEQISNENQMAAITEAIQGIAGEHASTTWWDTTITDAI